MEVLRTGTDDGAQMGSHFGVGVAVHFDRLSATPAAGSGFRWACLWGKAKMKDEI